MCHVDVDKLLRTKIGRQGGGIERPIKKPNSIWEIFKSTTNANIFNYKKLDIFHSFESLRMEFQLNRF